MEMNDTATHQPDHDALIVDRFGAICPAANRDSYPILTVCRHCGQVITCAGGQAPWTADGQARCAGPMAAAELVAWATNPPAPLRLAEIEQETAALNERLRALSDEEAALTAELTARLEGSGHE